MCVGDAHDALDVESAAACGVRLQQLLWIRCRAVPAVKARAHADFTRMDQALRATDLLLQAGVFCAGAGPGVNGCGAWGADSIGDVVPVPAGGRPYAVLAAGAGRGTAGAVECGGGAGVRHEGGHGRRQDSLAWVHIRSEYGKAAIYPVPGW